jgi:GTPase SAR1 family protein
MMREDEAVRICVSEEEDSSSSEDESYDTESTSVYFGSLESFCSPSYLMTPPSTSLLDNYLYNIPIVMINDVEVIEEQVVNDNDDSEEEYCLYYNDLYEQIDLNDIYDPLIYDGEEYCEILNPLYDGNTTNHNYYRHSLRLQVPISTVDPISPSSARSPSRLRSFSLKMSRVLAPLTSNTRAVTLMENITSDMLQDENYIGVELNGFQTNRTPRNATSPRSNTTSPRSPRGSGGTSGTNRHSLRNSLRLFFAKSTPTSPRSDNEALSPPPFSPTSIANIFMSRYDSESDSSRDEPVIPQSESTRSESARKKTILDADYQEFRKLKRSRMRAVSPFVKLPQEVLMVVISFLNFEDLLSLIIVNRPLFRICTHDIFWKDVCLDRKLDITKANNQFREFFLCRQVRVILVGDYEIGKTTLVQTMTNNPVYILESYASRQMDRHTPYHTQHCIDNSDTSYFFYLNDSNMAMNDIAESSGRFKTTDIVLVCFSTEDQHSFKVARKWLGRLKQVISERRIILVGTKTDARQSDIDEFEQPFIVTSEDGERLARSHALYAYNEVCALTKQGIEELFSHMINLKRSYTRLQDITVDDIE